jgi:hypothetical protein
MGMGRHVLFGTSGWGLGHATRDLVLIRALLEAGCRVTVVATGAAQTVLRRELGDACRYLDWPDMPSTIARSTLRFLVRTTLAVPRILGVWLGEQRRLRRLLRTERVDLIVSDHRYGLVTGRVPCYFISHSPRYIAPWRSRSMENLMEWFIARWLRPVRRIIVPDDDADESDGGLSGEMSHATRFVPRERLAFIGILSSLGRRECERDVDLFISVSGPEPQRTLFEETALAQLPALKGEGRIVLALGRPDRPAPAVPEGVEVYSYLDRDGQEAVMNRARLVVCRSGYTTLMELAELGRPALLVPTPGQTEQLYLAETLGKRGLFHTIPQRALDLARDVPIARRYPGYRAAQPTAASAERFRRLVLGPDAD